MTEPETDWECLSQLGSGGFGIVHVWRSVSSGRCLALKKCKARPQPTDLSCVSQNISRDTIPVTLLRKIY